MGAPRRLDDLSHAELAVIAREFLLAGQMIDRAGMPHLISAYGRDEMRDIAIDEWMGASPIYSRRMQRALRFEGDDVSTIFKGMQLDVGAPPEFMDFRYEVHDHDHGEFWLDHCGALVDVEPMGDDYVVAMCHHIEDPTFEATACASNPRARMTPIHRPPRAPADRHPHCHWTVDIVADADPIAEPDAAVLMASTRAARAVVEPFGGTDGDDRGWPDYSHALDPDMRLEDFSRRSLSVIAQEACLQGHLLAISFFAAIERRHGAEAAAAVADRQFVGVAGMTAGRLRSALGLGGDLTDVATVFELHPAFHPRGYIDWSVDLEGDRLTLELRECDALAESAAGSWITLLANGHSAGLDAIARGVDPRAAVVRRPPTRGGRASWEVVLGEDPAAELADVALTRFSSGSEFVFRRVGRRSGDSNPDPS